MAETEEICILVGKMLSFDHLEHFFDKFRQDDGTVGVGLDLLLKTTLDVNPPTHTHKA